MFPGALRVSLTLLPLSSLTPLVYATPLVTHVTSGSDKAEALPVVSSNKEKSGDVGVVEDMQRVSGEMPDFRFIAHLQRI